MPAPDVDWSTTGLIERLKELYSQTPPLTTQQIAATLNVEYPFHFTRNAIIGKRFRLALPYRPDAPKNNNAIRPPVVPKKIIRVDAPIAPRPQPVQLRHRRRRITFLAAR